MLSGSPKTLGHCLGRRHNQIPDCLLRQRFRIRFVDIPILIGRQIAFVRRRWQWRPRRSSQEVKHRQVDAKGHRLQHMDGIQEGLHLTSADRLAGCILDRRMVIANKRRARPVVGGWPTRANLRPGLRRHR